MSSSTATIVHLVILIHGLYGNPDNLLTASQELKKAQLKSLEHQQQQQQHQQLRSTKEKTSTPEVEINKLESTPRRRSARLKTVSPATSTSSIRSRRAAEFATTEDELDRDRSNAGEEEVVIYRCKSFTGSHTWDGIDVNGHRAAEEVDEEISRLESEGKEIGYISLMGYSLGGQSRANTIIHTIGRRLFSRSGQQMYCLDKGHGDRCLLEIMSDPNGVFVKALQQFPKIMILANGCHDNTVPYPTASISLHDPFADHTTTPIQIDVDENQIVQGWQYLPNGPSAFGNEVATEKLVSTAEVVHPGINGEDDVKIVVTVQERKRRVVKRPMRLPPMFFLLPWPFGYILLALVPFLLPFFLLYASILFTIHTFQSSKRHRSHHSLLERPIHLLENNEEAKPLLSTTAQPRISELIKSEKSQPDIPSGTSTPAMTPPPETPNIPPNRIPLLLTPNQKQMITNLNNSLPQMERLIAWFPWVFNTHSMLIMRDYKRFPFQEDARGVVRTWAEWVVAH